MFGPSSAILVCILAGAAASSGPGCRHDLELVSKTFELPVVSGRVPRKIPHMSRSYGSEFSFNGCLFPYPLARAVFSPFPGILSRGFLRLGVSADSITNPLRFIECTASTLENRRSLKRPAYARFLLCLLGYSWGLGFHRHRRIMWYVREHGLGPRLRWLLEDAIAVRSAINTHNVGALRFLLKPYQLQGIAQSLVSSPQLLSAVGALQEPREPPHRVRMLAHSVVFQQNSFRSIDDPEAARFFEALLEINHPAYVAGLVEQRAQLGGARGVLPELLLLSGYDTRRWLVEFGLGEARLVSLMDRLPTRAVLLATIEEQWKVSVREQSHQRAGLRRGIMALYLGLSERRLEPAIALAAIVGIPKAFGNFFFGLSRKLIVETTETAVCYSILRCLEGKITYELAMEEVLRWAIYMVNESSLGDIALDLGTPEDLFEGLTCSGKRRLLQMALAAGSDPRTEELAQKLDARNLG